MKLLLLICVALVNVSCILFTGTFSGKSWSWKIHNDTEQTLTLRYPHSSSMFLHDSDYRETEIKPGEEISLCGDRLDEQDFSFQFDHYFKKSAEAFGEDVSWQILSEHGEVLKTWGYSERDLPGRRFFEESSWDHYEQWEWSAGEFWNFTILPEDIALAE